MATGTMERTAAPRTERIRLTGGAIFAAATLIVLGGLNLVNGYTAIENSSYFKSQIVYDNLTFWGWAFLIWGALELIAGALVFFHSRSGYYMGIGIAMTAAVLWFFMIFAAPWAALVGVLVSMVVLFSLTSALEDAVEGALPR
jgi:hypothetical protein